ncbi:hypothetical protein Drorol1_Dr00026450 [Drosera rotundifolia]
MEDEKKKKNKNKKKKNKQTKAAHDLPVPVTSSAAAALDTDTASSQGESRSSQQHYENGMTCPVPADGIGQIIQDNSMSQNFQSNEAVHLANGTSDRSIIDERNLLDWLQREARLQEMVEQLEHDKVSSIQREAHLEVELQQLLSEKDSWLYLQASLEQRISQLVQEKAAFSEEEIRMREILKSLESESLLWMKKENSSKDFIANLQDDNTSLQNQVTELQKSNKHLSQENEKLRTDITVLTSRIQDLESSLHNPLPMRETPKVSAEMEDLNSQIEAMCALVGKLMTENAELVEKVTELYIERDQCTAKTWDPPSAGLSGPVPRVDTVDTDGNDKFVESKSFSEALVEDERPIHHDYKDLGYVVADPNSSETSVSEEIVQIPLVDDNKVQDFEAKCLIRHENEVVHFSDAPLIGAPFRLFSFVAKYVSGADLVSDRSTVRSED